MFKQLIANYQTAEQTVNDLAILWDKPACGIPGFGFKAARKAQPQRYVASVAFTNAKIALRNYVQETKLSKERRVRRFENVQRLIPTFTLD